MRNLSSSPASSSAASPAGALIRRWRTARGMSQLDLALAAEVSTKHVSFVETGRAAPSREMVLILASVLSIPLRERNSLLHAAGYAPVYRETGLETPQMEQVRQALRLILRQQEPFGGLVLDRDWDVVMMNQALCRLWTMLTGISVPAYEILPPPRPNGLRVLFGDERLRSHIANWEAVGCAVLSRVRRDLGAASDPGRAARIDAILKESGVSAHWLAQDFAEAPALIIPVEVVVRALRLRFLSTIATLGTPQDITLDELRIESFYPADEQTLQTAQSWAKDHASS